MRERFLHLLQERVDVLKGSLELAEKTVRDNRTRVEVGVLPPVAVLESEADVAYVTSWERLIDDSGEAVYPEEWRWHYRFISNFCPSVFDENIAGDAPGVFRRALFDAGFCYNATLAAYEDWDIYQRLARAGRYGHVIPEGLVAYRVRPDSLLRKSGLPNDRRLRGELAAANVARENGWSTQ